MDRSNLLFALYMTASLLLMVGAVLVIERRKKIGNWVILTGAAFGMTALWIPVFWY